MTKQIKPKSSLETLLESQQLNAIDSAIATKALLDINERSDMSLLANTLLTQKSAVDVAQKLIEENSLAKSIAAAELKRVEEFEKLLDPYQGLQKLLNQNANIQATIDTAQLADIRAKYDPKLIAAEAFSTNLDQYRVIAKQFESCFSLPNAVETNRLLAEVNALGSGSMAAFARQSMGDILSLEAFAASISSPWMREFEAARSASALIELHALGSALRFDRVFDDQLTLALRTDLGDWRDHISFPNDVYDDPIARTSFYVDRGFNSSLTDFPDPAFQEGLKWAGLDEEVEISNTIDFKDAVEETAFKRTQKCFSRLQKLERRIREFIDQEMTKQYGPDWPRKKLNPEMFDSWEFKKSRIENSGSTISMFIEVADFTDYEKIICRKDHWREVFQNRFSRKESVRESFQRLYPIRLATMHARFVTKEDELYVLAESTRLLHAITL